MTAIGWIQIALYCAIIVAITPVLGAYMTRVFNGERNFLTPILRPVELALYRAAGVEEKREQGWLAYTVGMLLFHVGGFFILYALMRFQASLPFNPAEQSAVAPDLAFNTAISFITNTNWQNYGGEGTLSYLSADARPDASRTICRRRRASCSPLRLFAVLRVTRRRPLVTSGSISRAARFMCSCPSASWRALLVWQGMPQTLGRLCRGDDARRRQADHRGWPGGLAGRDQDAGHQWRRLLQRQCRASVRKSDALSNFLQIILIFAIGAALTNVFGRMVGNQRQGWAILAVMGVLFLRRRRSCLLGGGARQRHRQRAWPHRRQHGRQGSALRHCRLGAVRGDHHRRLLRRRQRHA